MNHEDSIEPASDIAVIGYAARFPGAENAAQFWENICHGVESIRSFSVEELESVGVSKSLLRDPDYVRAGAPLSNLDAFDPSFFGINPREAAIMDPQQRFFMESAWEALEHAGYAPGTFSGSTGVFAGSGPNSYLFNNLLSDPGLVEKEGIFLLRHTGNDKDVLATRLSYQMNLRGPSLNVQTACSTSLVAVHLACQSLLHLDCDMAIAGAVSIEIPHAIGYPYRQNEIQSHDGHCRAFDANATGTVFGSGLGIVILRRLSEAIAARDTIHAVIKGTAVNNDGSRKVGFLAPSVEGQVEVILEALGVAGVTPASIDYVETHGTGTPIGDPIELSALSQVFAGRDRPLQIGSVKTNIGHLDTAAGMAGLLKTVLALRRRQIPATLHFKTLNPLIDAAPAKLRVVDRLTEWKTDPAENAPRRAGVTSLGIGGTNAHVILEEPPELPPSHAERPLRLFTLSAKSAAALEDATHSLAGHLLRFPNENLDDIAHTLHVGRSEFAHRRMFVARDQAEALQHSRRPHSPAVVTGKTSDFRSVAFLFSGQGTQVVDMARDLHQTEPVFRKWIDACAGHARPHLGFDFRHILYPSQTAAAEAAEQIKLTWNAQPILFAVEYALARLWMSWGVRPARLIGHSLGEYPAACLSGIFTLEDAVALVCARGNLMKKVAEGAMLAVPLSETETAPWIADGLSLAAVNAPRQCVISGPAPAIAELKDRLHRQGIASHRLPTSHAFHSPSIDPILDSFVKLVGQKQLRPPQIPLVSNVTGAWLTEKEATDPAYWARHFRQTVRFAQGLETLQADPAAFLLEIGPGETLSALAMQNGGKGTRSKIFSSLPRSGEKNGDLAAILSTLGNLWVNGLPVDWKAFHAHERLRRIPLPTYSFQRKKFWMGPKIGSNWLAGALRKVDDWFYRSSWKPAPLPAAAPSAGPWLVLADPSPANQALIDELRKQKASVITVLAGEKFQSPADDSYVMNLSSEADYALLFDHLARRQQLPRRIVHLWGLEPDPAANEDRCFHSLLFLIQTLGARLPDQPVALTAVSRRSVSIRREPVLHPHGSLLSGPCRVAPLEYPNLRCRQIDVDSTDPAPLAQTILREAESDTSVTLAVYRDGSRWTEDIESFRLEPAADRPLRDQGVYLITGGLGGLGMAVAGWLAQTCRARLVLISRHGEPRDADTQSRFAEWRKLGAEVLPLAADVTDCKSLQRALDAAREKFGPLHGIVHAAGILQDGIIQLKKKDTAHRVLAPKTAGLEILDELTGDNPLDFFALFSSVSAVTPPDGQVDYCAANAFLNAFAQSRPPERNFIVIGWGPWAEIGMVAPKPGTASQAPPFRHPFLERLDLDTAARTIHSGTLSVERHWVLAEHRFHGGDSLLPGTAHLEIAVAALWQKIGRQPVTLENVVFLAPLRVAPNSPEVIHAELQKAGPGYQFSVSSHGVVFVSGQCRRSPGNPPRIKLKEILARCPVEKRAPINVRQRGHFDFGPRWQSLRRISFGKDECLGALELPSEFRSETGDFALHPALMDIATGVAMYLVPGYENAGDLFLPFAYKRLTLYGVLPPRLYSHARIRPNTGSDLLVFDVTLAAENGEVVAEIEEFTVRRLRGIADLSHPITDSAPLASLGTDDSPGPLAAIPTKEGLEAFQRILKSRPADIVFVSPTKLSPAVPMRETETLADSVTAGAGDIELVLMQLWKRLLGLDQVDATTDFFDSGGHSLLAVRLFTEIRNRFNVDFGLSTLFEARTVGALAALIRKAREADPSQKNPASSLVPIRPRGANAPLFLIHSLGGNVLSYEHLARHFPDDHAIYAIESRGLRGLPADFKVETMAANYIQQIRERQPHGPYFLAGHSFGGQIAYEIARQLTDQNEPLGLIGLIDTFQANLVPGDELLQQERHRFEEPPLSQSATTFLRTLIDSRDRIGYLRETKNHFQNWFAHKTTRALYRSTYFATSRLGSKMPSFLNDVNEANAIASDNYIPHPYHGPVVFFRCKNRPESDPSDSSGIWRRLVGGDLLVIDVPGDHNSMLNEPHVRVLAEQISTFLQPKTTTPAVTAEASVP
ncbi:MAG TPA: SDR family NAD(P)-dependent oxidoreductase [Candidatus Methylacidiphilales bacterium]|jgi:acyl transferase domain-containing protein/thioesterase domain-containing protein/acyl carrier protein|nr:SDR family NAD(P)-dependent oxidoreductase [Candidatus Methylacidiphilales bacterium]